MAVRKTTPLGIHKSSIFLPGLSSLPQVLTVLSGLVAAATSLSTSPPPAIAATLAQQSRDELQKCGRVTPQLRKVAECY